MIPAKLVNREPCLGTSVKRTSLLPGHLPEEHLIANVRERLLLALSLHGEDVFDLHLVLLMRRRMGRLQVLLDQLIDILGFVHGLKMAFQLLVLLIDGVQSRVGVGVGVESAESHFDVVESFEQFDFAFQMRNGFDQRRRASTELVRD